MGISVAGKAVSINDMHEEGVDTSVARNPTSRIFQGIELHHMFSRSGKTGRKDDGNPLIHALKGRYGFTITPFWKAQLMGRADLILDKAQAKLAGFTHCMPIPSSSPFCSEVTDLVANKLGLPVLQPTFFRKKTVREMLDGLAAHPPKVRKGQKTAYNGQLNTWQALPDATICEAKNVDTNIRLLFDFFVLLPDALRLEGQRILIVDDIFSSGSSVLSVREIVSNQLGAEVGYVSFLSGMR